MLGASGLATSGLAAKVLAAKVAPRRWGLQMFTIIAPLEQDFEGVIGKVAAMGYKEVETIGSFGRDPAYVRALLEKNGLTSPSQHIASKPIYDSFSAWSKRQITTEQNRANYVAAFELGKSQALIAEAIVNAKALGQQYVVWPILMPQQLATLEILEGYLKIFNLGGKMCADAGLTFAFHNHAREFAKLGNDVIYDIILAETDPKLVKMELDFYWISQAGGDPIAYLAANKGRFFGCHLKDKAPNGDITGIGKGTVDIPGLIGKARAAGVEHFYVEYDRSNDPMLEVREAIEYLKTYAK